MTASPGLPGDGPPDDDALFLKALVKASRQRPHHVRWTDRDGSARLTVLTPADARRLNAIARVHHGSPDAVLRQAAHVPVRIDGGGP